MGKVKGLLTASTQYGPINSDLQHAGGLRPRYQVLVDNQDLQDEVYLTPH